MVAVVTVETVSLLLKSSSSSTTLGFSGSFSTFVVFLGFRFRRLLALESMESSFDALLLFSIGDVDGASVSFPFADGTLVTEAEGGSSAWFCLAVTGGLLLCIGLWLGSRGDRSGESEIIIKIEKLVFF
jgi:hypothetical protein